MCKAAKELKVLYPAMIHVTCVVHATRRVAKGIRLASPQLDLLVSNTKKAFLKAPSRVASFGGAAPDVPLPPQPIRTRWGTWINAVAYYRRHFNLPNFVLEQLTDDAVSATA
ncbi:unnamed protein product, partial [Ixodes hexagonus]